MATAKNQDFSCGRKCLVEDKKMVMLEFQITNARYRRGFDVRTANDEEQAKKLLQELQRLEWQQTRRCSGKGTDLVKKKKRRMSEELEVEVTIDPEKDSHRSPIWLAVINNEPELPYSTGFSRNSKHGPSEGNGLQDVSSSPEQSFS